MSEMMKLAPIVMPTRAMARVRCCSRVELAIMAEIAAEMAPAPCTARPRMMSGSVWANPARNEPAAKISSPMHHHRLAAPAIAGKAERDLQQRLGEAVNAAAPARPAGGRCRPARCGHRGQRPAGSGTIPACAGHRSRPASYWRGAPERSFCRAGGRRAPCRFRTSGRTRCGVADHMTSRLASGGAARGRGTGLGCDEEHNGYRSLLNTRARLAPAGAGRAMRPRPRPCCVNELDCQR